MGKTLALQAVRRRKRHAKLVRFDYIMGSVDYSGLQLSDYPVAVWSDR